MTTLLEVYTSAQGKLFRERENYKHDRGHDPGDELTSEEGAIVLLVTQVESGAVSGDSLRDEEREVCKWHLTHNQSTTGGD
ncbi:MAG: hypothetical protein ACLP36_04465 [Acidimicrobiales bacterium]